MSFRSHSTAHNFAQKAQISCKPNTEEFYSYVEVQPIFNKVKVMDISRLAPLINALRAETEEDSITPETLGTDAFDKLYIEAEKFPQHEVYPLALSGIL